MKAETRKADRPFSISEWIPLNEIEEKRCKCCDKLISTKKVYCDVYCMKTAYRKTKKKVVCIICGKSKYLSPNKGAIQRYCSQQCYHITQLGKKRPDHSKKMKGKRIGLGRKLTIDQRNKISGKNHWRFGTGKNKNFIKEKIRKLAEYSIWRMEVYSRDFFTCQKCKTKNVRLECHHIVPFSEILSKFNIKTTDDAISCSNLWDINNGITFCKPCHKKTDSYGRYNKHSSA